MLVEPADAADAAARCGRAVEISTVALDDAWLRDTGPLVVHAEDGSQRAVDFGFNAWGGKYDSWKLDGAIAAHMADLMEIERLDVTDMVLEGGSIAGDGAGTLLTTERCLLHPNRNRSLSRLEIEDRLGEVLGAERVIWLPDGLVEDDETDGHVDNVAAFVRPGVVLLQGCAQDGNPNREVARANRAVLEAAELAVIEVPELPYCSFGGRSWPVPLLNFYVCNGGLVVPVCDETRSRDLDTLGEAFGDRDLVTVDAAAIAAGGGGVHCVTMQIPAA